MSVSKLTKWIETLNIAEDLDDSQLSALAARVQRQYDEDLESMSGWIEDVTQGIKLMRQEYKPKSSPWQGASNYKDPILTEASIKFGDKATLELLRPKDLVGTQTIGRDPDGQKKLIAERVAEALNYQINYDIEDWREEQERLYYCLPNVGTVFKKTVYDAVEDKCETCVIQYPDFVVNNATKTMDKCRSFSHVLDYSKNDVLVRVNAGKWLDIDYADEQDGDTGSNEQQGVEQSIDNPEKYIEQQTYFDLDGDGYEEPYIVTLAMNRCKVVRVVARYDEQSIIVEYEDRLMPLAQAKQMQAERELGEFGGAEALQLLGLEQPEVSDADFDVIKIVPFQNVTKYGFIPAPDGTFLDYGYCHLLGALTQAMNTMVNQLVDRGTLNNVGGGLLSKEFRKTMGLERLKMGQYVKTDVPASVLASGVYSHPIQEPSQTLYGLAKDFLARSGNFMALIDVSGQIQANTAPTTALAIIQEAVIPTTALFRRILNAQTKEFKVLFRINQKTMKPEKYQRITGDPEANPELDFNEDSYIVCPTANAEAASKMQKIQMAVLEMEQVPMIIQAKGNPVPVIRGFFEAIGSEKWEAIFPDEGALSPEEKEIMQNMQQAQEQANQIQELQLQILTREQDRLDRKTDVDIQKIQQEMKNLFADMIETLSRAAKLGEEAETEHMKNQVTTYTAKVQTIQETLSAIGAMSNARSINLPPSAGPTGYNPGAIQ
jgi:chaperonin GroES